MFRLYTDYKFFRSTKLKKLVLNAGIEPKKVIIMSTNTPRFTDQCNYILQFNGLSTITLSSLKDIRALNHTIIQWAHYKSKKSGVSICRNCCQFGQLRNATKMHHLCRSPQPLLVQLLTSKARRQVRAYTFEAYQVCELWRKSPSHIQQLLSWCTKRPHLVSSRKAYASFHYKSCSNRCSLTTCTDPWLINEFHSNHLPIRLDIPMKIRGRIRTVAG